MPPAKYRMRNRPGLEWSTDLGAVEGIRPINSWTSGTTVVLQEVWQGKLWSARPVTVVDDGEDCIALWCPKGTKWKTATMPPYGERAATRAQRFVSLLTEGDWVFGDFSWGVSNLILVRSGEWHAVWVGWDDGGDSLGWYVNFQRPYQRTPRGLQTMDLMLDLVVSPMRILTWKDMDEFDALVNPGIISNVEATRVRLEAQTMLDRIQTNDRPFCEAWHEWRPNPRWSPPELPKDWQIV